MVERSTEFTPKSWEGFRVVLAENGREAFFVARHEKPDLILLDMLMPEMNGYDFIRAYAKEDEAPIILLTAKLEEADEVGQGTTFSIWLPLQ